MDDNKIEPPNSRYEQCQSKVVEAHIKDACRLCKSYYTVNFDFPGNGAGAFVELDYKNNMQFIIGLEVTEPSNVTSTDNTIINASYDDSGNLIWKKIYVSLTELINLHPNATGYRVYVKAINPDAQNGLFALIDNFKVVYGN